MNHDVERLATPEQIFGAEIEVLINSIRRSDKASTRACLRLQMLNPLS
jgi:hypothetical protein